MRNTASGGLSVLRLGFAKAKSATALFRHYVRLVPRLGLPAASVLLFGGLSELWPLSRIVRPIAPRLLTIKPLGYMFPLTVRRAGSDRIVVREVLGAEEYGPVARLSNVRLIVDCGANIGVTSYYLLHRYPEARLIALEPDEDNYELCRRNLRAFGPRVVMIRGALWPECRSLRISPASRGLAPWEISVEPAEAHEGTVEGITIPELLRLAGIDPPIDLLKIDIEGAEVDVFNGGADWLDAVRNLAIELHSPAARTAFAAALAPYECAREESNQTTIVRDVRRRV